MSARRQGHGDDGQVASSLLVLVTLLLLFVTVSALLPLGRAGDLQTRAQSAADAAALAGAQHVRDAFAADLLAGVVVGPDGPVFGDLQDRSLGFGQAAGYAAANQASVAGAVSAYVWDPVTSTVRVHVTGTPSVQGQQAQADATASLGIDLSACRFRKDPAATPVLLACGSLVVPGEDDGEGHFRPDLAGLVLKDLIVPRLVR